MGVIVLDASVLIGHLDARDPHHEKATALLEASDAESLGASAITLAETLVAPARAKRLDDAATALERLGVEELELGEGAPARLAKLRAGTGRKLPDCCVLAAAQRHGGSVASFDGDLRKGGAQAGAGGRRGVVAGLRHRRVRVELRGGVDALEGEVPAAPAGEVLEAADLGVGQPLAVQGSDVHELLLIDQLCYVSDLVTRDVEQLEESPTRRRDPLRLRRYLEAYAHNSAGVADHRTIYETADVSKMTAAAYEGLLEDLLIAERVPAWTSNRLKRLARRPKRYLIDSSLLAADLGVDERDVIRDGNLLGRVLDTFVAAQLRTELAASSTRPRLHHLRAPRGAHEIDLIAELGGGRLIAIEVKAGGAVRGGDARHLRWLRDEVGDSFVAGVVLHTGLRVYQLEERIVAAPIATLWS